MKFDSLKDWIEKLRDYSNFSVIIVEGKNDKKVLASFNIKNIYPIQGKRFYDIVEELEFAELCIILVDLDKQGEKIYTKLKYFLEKEGIPTNSEFRNYLKNYNIKEIEHIHLIGELWWDILFLL